MSEKDRKREAAMRLFGALSGVDEEYLAACEADTGKAAADAGEGFAGPKPVPFERLGSFVRKYGMAVAAVLCVAVFGVSMAGYRLGGSKTMDSTQNRFVALQQENTAGAAMDQEEEAAPEAPAAANRISADEGTEHGNSITDGMSDIFSTKEVMQDDLQEKNAESSVDQDLAHQRLGSRESVSRSDKDMTLEHAREVEVVGRYLPEVFPESGEINILRGTDEEGQERVTLGWNTDKAAPSACWFYLTIENLGDSLPDWLDTGTVIEEEQLNGGNVEGCLAMGTANAVDLGTSERALSVLYENQGNYVLLNISGEISVEEVWEMLDSINKP